MGLKDFLRLFLRKFKAFFLGGISNNKTRSARIKENQAGKYDFMDFPPLLIPHQVEKSRLVKKHKKRMECRKPKKSKTLNG